jgi:hypothetical protein
MLASRDEPLQRRDVDPVHAEHALRHAVCLHGIRIAHQLEQLHRDDLPGQPEPVDEPAAPR